jgi:glyoxylase-like metal-dependent hydrolase (beta-lactamase superfamily II)
MISIKKFEFNDFQVNTLLLWDETKEAVIIDPGNSNEQENKRLDDYIKNEGLMVVGMYNTHLHIDHMFGNDYIKNKYGVKFLIHEEGIHFLNTAIGFASVFGYDLQKVAQPDGNMKEGDVISFGNSKLDVIETPGHAAGSFCFICREQKFVIVGDVLFSGSVGRTDLPSGDMDTLVKMIRTKLFPLGDSYKVYCGHGPETTIGEERQFNPFLT